MTTPAFDEIRTSRALAELEKHQQLAFGAACCGRILDNYATFSAEVDWGDPQPLRRALDYVWQVCSGRQATAAKVRELVRDCEGSAPDSEDFDSLLVSSAQDAVFALCSLLDFVVEEGIGQLVNAARYPTDSIDLFVQEVETVYPADPDLERKILEHPLMQQELQRQSRDLEDAKQLSWGNTAALVAFSDRARRERAFHLP